MDRRATAPRPPWDDHARPSMLLLGLLVFAGFAHANDVADLAVVNTTYGAVRGRPVLTTRGRIFLAFEGVPFARPPLGDLRFRPPRPSRPWPGVREARAPPSPCTQISAAATNGSRKVVGSEDCLYVSVYSRGLWVTDDVGVKGKVGQPVLVWVHGGGGFAAGGVGPDHMGPELLMESEVVVVVPQFRLGVLGFFSSGDTLVPGNYGLKDLTAALHWTRANAASFGGDARRVTVAGAGAGAALAHLLALAPEVAGRRLVQRAALFGGSALASWAFQSDPRPAARSLAQAAGCPLTRDPNAHPALSKATIKCLRDADAGTLVVAASKLPHWSEGGAAAFAPVAEPVTKSKGRSEEGQDKPLLVAQPAAMLRARAFSAPELPLLVSATAGAADLLPPALQRNAELRRQVLRDLRDTLERQLARGGRPGLTAPAVALQQALSLYGSEAGEDDLSALADALGDAWMGHPATLAARLTASSSSAPVYFLLVEMDNSRLAGADGDAGAGEGRAPAAPTPPRTAAELADLLEDLQPRPGLPSRWSDSWRSTSSASWARFGRRRAALILAQVVVAFASSTLPPAPRRWSIARNWRPLSQAGRFRLLRAPPPPALLSAEDASAALIARVDFWDEQLGAVRLLYAPESQRDLQERRKASAPRLSTPPKPSMKLQGKAPLKPIMVPATRTSVVYRGKPQPTERKKIVPVKKLSPSAAIEPLSLKENIGGLHKEKPPPAEFTSSYQSRSANKKNILQSPKTKVPVKTGSTLLSPTQRKMELNVDALKTDVKIPISQQRVHMETKLDIDRQRTVSAPLIPKHPPISLTERNQGQSKPSKTSDDEGETSLPFITSRVKGDMSIPTKTLIHKDLAEDAGSCICVLGPHPLREISPTSQCSVVESFKPAGKMKYDPMPSAMLNDALRASKPGVTPGQRFPKLAASVVSTSTSLSKKAATQEREWQGTCLRANREE